VLEIELFAVSFSLKMLRPAKKELEKMDNTRAQKIYDHIELLKRDPFRPRPGMNINKVAGKQKPPAYRLKIGRIRVEYFVDGQMIVIFNIFMKKRKSDYR
jgi:mRNA-degrading endonuclease RelE of RelBE toxin-antitoxin system